MRASGLSGPGSAALPAGRGDLAPSPRVARDDRGVFLQRVPSNCGIPGNDAADALAREAAAMAQEKAPVDTTSVYRAATRLAKYRTGQREAEPPWRRPGRDRLVQGADGGEVPTADRRNGQNSSGRRASDED